MLARSNFGRVGGLGWQIFAQGNLWTGPLKEKVLALVLAQTSARHPQTIELRHPADGSEQVFFLKVFHRTSPLAAFKDLFRTSRAFGSWRQGLALSAAGFNAPIPRVVGKQSGWRASRREFTLTPRIDGLPLNEYCLRQCGGGAAPFGAKRMQIRQLARLIRRFHDAGFVHGDLVASNILVNTTGATGPRFFFMDNDRTRRYPAWFCQSFWKRNLIQLNRLPLPGISLQDRMCFLQAYLGVKRLSRADRRLARWLEAKTRERRRECDGADPSESFRRLMRWSADVAPSNRSRIG